MTKSIKESYHNREVYEEELTQEELKFFKNALEEEKVKIEKNLHEANKESCTQTANRCKDEGDQVSLEVTNNVNSTIYREQGIKLNKINRSLNKIAIGTYGTCSLCEEAINIERLKIQMFTEYCVPCLEIMERRQ